ncbi:MAG: class I SAM-dependent methyltransferase [Rubrivivax sp.]|nr:class I SAM-dependent methyltransferase [Rubrivivax sp.]
MSTIHDRIRRSATRLVNRWRAQTPDAGGAANLVAFGASEDALARAYLSAIATDRRSFFDGVSAEDEMYIYLRNNLPKRSYALQEYMYGGKEAVQVIENIIGAAGKTFDGVRSFLDFACGYGKSTRFLVQRLAPDRIWVSDIYTGAVDFQRMHLGVNGFYSAINPDDVKFPRKYEIIYVGSLFSHLAAPQFKAWLARLYGVLADDGLLIFSTHGESVQALSGESARDGYMFIPVSESRSLDKNEYGSSTVTEKWVRNLAAELRIAQVHYLQSELWAQDVYVVARSKTLLGDRPRPNPFPRGTIEGAFIDSEGRLQISGWAMSRRTGAPVEAVRIMIGSTEVGYAELGLSRPDVATYFKRPDIEYSGWRYIGKLNSPLQDSQDAAEQMIINVLIMERDGAETCLVASMDTMQSKSS